MAYAAQSDLSPGSIPQSDLVALTDDTNSGTVNADVVTAKLDEASALIDSYARQRYAVPLQQSEQVKGLCLRIATYLLYLRRNRVIDSVQQAYTDAVNFLKDVSTGKAALDQPSGQPAQQSGGAPEVSDTPERFSDCNLEGFV